MLPSQSDKDLFYMQLALLEAKKAYQKGEVPVGAILVYKDIIIAQSHNIVEELQDATAHAEILCLRRATKSFQNWRLLDSTLYCTLEPCSMCAGAMLLSRIRRLVWGAPDLRHGANGSWIDLFQQKHPCHALEICSKVRAEESANLLKKFFRERRNENKTTSKSLIQSE